jgi:hypothetical protein
VVLLVVEFVELLVLVVDVVFVPAPDADVALAGAGFDAVELPPLEPPPQPAMAAARVIATTAPHAFILPSIISFPWLASRPASAGLHREYGP